MCWRSHGTKSRVIREEVGSRRRGEDRKKCSFSLCVSVLSVGTVPATLLQNALIMPRYERSLKGLRCVSLCPFVSPTAYVCIWVPIYTCAGTMNLRAHSCGPRLTHLRCYRRSKRDVRMVRQERNVSGNGRKGGTDRERQSEGVEEKHEVIGGTFTSAGSLTSLSLSFLSLVSHSFCASLIPCSLCLSVISLSLSHSLPAAIPTAFSGVAQQKKTANSLTVAGAVIWVSSHMFLQKKTKKYFLQKHTCSTHLFLNWNIMWHNNNEGGKNKKIFYLQKIGSKSK